MILLGGPPQEVTGAVDACRFCYAHESYNAGNLLTLNASYKVRSEPRRHSGENDR